MKNYIESNQPKVLVGCPTSFHKEYAFSQYAEIVKNLNYPNYDVLLVDNSPNDYYLNKNKKYGLDVIKGPYFEGALDRIISSRNILRDHAINNNYDYLFSLEQDVLLHKDALSRLISHNKQVVSGVYFLHNIINNKRVLIPQAFKVLNDQNEVKKDDLPSMIPINESEFLSNKLIKIVSCGLGCVLIHKDVLKEIKFRYENKVFDDRFFCIDLYKKNISIYCDTSIKCKHLTLNRPYSWQDIKK